MRRITTFLMVAAFAVATVFAAAEKTAAPNTTPAFERIKALAGTWTGTAGEEGQPAQPTTVTYRVVGGGSAVLETLFPGTPHEMVSVYHMDGPDLVMTHYCAAGNQPHMKATSTDGKGPITFRFVSGGNMKPDDLHMHELVMTFPDEKHVHAVWTSYAKGAPAGAAVFELSRANG